LRSKAKTNRPHSFCEYGNFAEKVLRDRGEHCASPSHQYIFDTMTIVDANTFPNRLPSAQRAVTASQNGFGAHNCNPLRLRKFYQIVQICPELRLVHVIGEATEAGVMPTGVEGFRRAHRKPPSPGIYL